MMSSIRAIVNSGKLACSVPSNWPDGTEVEIRPLAENSVIEDEIVSPEEIAAALLALDNMEPVAMNEDDLANWESMRKADRDRDKARFANEADRLRRNWE